MNKTKIFRLLILCSIFSAQTFFAAERSCLDRVRRFAEDFDRTGTCVGACIGETDPLFLNEIRRAESRYCTACCRCCCFTASFLTVGLIKYNLPPTYENIIHGCTRVGVVAAAGKSIVGCCLSCYDAVKEGAYLTGLAHQSYEDRRTRASHQMDEFLASEVYRLSAFNIIDASHPRYARPVQQRMEMNPTPIRRYSGDARFTDHAEDPTHLQ